MKKSHIEQAKKSSPYKQKNSQFIKSHLKKKMRLKMKQKKHEIHSQRRSFNQNDILDQLVKEEWEEMVKENPDFVNIEDLDTLMMEVREELLVKEFEDHQRWEEGLLEEQIRSFELQKCDEELGRVKIEQQSQESIEMEE